MATADPPARRSGAAARRRDREREILAATKALLDRSEGRDVQIEDVAREAGLNRAIIYRHFSGKEELLALTIVSYVDDLLERFAALPEDESTTEGLLRLTEAFFDFCLEHPAFVDVALSMLRQPGKVLLEQIDEGAMLRMGRAVAEALHRPVALLRQGEATGEFRVEDADYAANAMYVQILGLAHLARVGNGIRELPGGLPWFFPIAGDQVRETVRRLVVASLGASAAPAG